MTCTAPRPTTPTGTACSAGCTCRTCAARCGTTSSNWRRNSTACPPPSPGCRRCRPRWPRNPGRSTGLQIALRDDGLASAHELSSYLLNHNFGDTLRRYHEHYHDKISQGESRHHGDGIASAHDIVRFKHPISSADIVPDDLPRTLWRDELDGAPLTDYRANGLHFSRPHIDKTYALDGNTITVSWQLTGLAGRQFSTVLNLAMPSCDGFLGRYVLADGHPRFRPATHPAGRQHLQLEDGVLGGHLCLRPGRPPTSAARRIKPSRSPRPALRKSCRLSNCA
jgi:hypothetical protein